MHQQTHTRSGRPPLALSLLVAVALATSACGQTKPGANVAIQGITGPDFSFVNNTFDISLVINSVNFVGGGQVPIPKMPNSYVSIGPDLQSNGTLISVGLNINDLLALTKASVNQLDPLTLPGGRALPGVLAGYLPGLALQVPKWDNIVFYIGTNVFGVFVPVKLPWQNYIGTFRFYDTAGDDIGNLSVVGEDTNNKNSGILLLINIAGKIASQIGV